MSVFIDAKKLNESGSVFYISEILSEIYRKYGKKASFEFRGSKGYLDRLVLVIENRYYECEIEFQSCDIYRFDLKQNGTVFFDRFVIDSSIVLLGGE